jgi:hypothetical protein
MRQAKEGGLSSSVPRRSAVVSVATAERRGTLYEPMLASLSGFAR